MANYSPLNPKSNPFYAFALSVYLASQTTLEFLDFFETYHAELNKLFFNPDTDIQDI